jgi:hypothetical protein
VRAGAKNIPIQARFMVLSVEVAVGSGGGEQLRGWAA